MRRAIRRAVGVFVDAFEPSGPVVEIGSYYQPGAEALGDLRPLFPRREYLGCDLRRGPGVDRIEDANALSLADRSAGVVVMCEILEHLPDPDRAVAESHRVLRDDGLLVVSVPFTYRLHGFPSDYWRYTASGVHVMLEAFPSKIVCAVGPRLKPAFIFAVAARSEDGRFAEAAARFRSQLDGALARTRLQGLVSALKERGRDFFGCLLGRAELGVAWFDPQTPGIFRRE